MINLQKLCVLLCLLIVINSFSQDSKTVYMFGHSLMVHHPPLIPTPSNETSIPHWLHFLSEAEGNTFSASGQYGSLWSHANYLPPDSQWGFDYVTQAWDSENEPFSEADFDIILSTPANFVQYQPSDAPYYNDPNTTPVSATTTIMDWIDAEEPTAVNYIYENWPDMAGFIAGEGFPPTEQEFANYNTYTQGGFHDWFIDYQDFVLAERPNENIRMIPVGPILGKLLFQAPLNQIPILDLYEDNAPHGRPTLYFLASLVTHMAINEEKISNNYVIPDTVSSIVQDNYQSTIDFIWDELLGFNDNLGVSRVFVNNPLNITSDAFTEISIYPNPTEGTILINDYTNSNSFDLYTINGVQLNKKNYILNNEIDLSNLPNGVYFLQLNNEDSFTENRVFKVIKN